MIFAFGLKVGVENVMAGDRTVEGVERGKACCGGEKSVCMLAVEPTLAVRARGTGEG